MPKSIAVPRRGARVALCAGLFSALLTACGVSPQDCASSAAAPDVFAAEAGTTTQQGTLTPGTVQQRQFTNAAGTRAYQLYVPTTGAAGKPMVVWLHGCGDSATLTAQSALALLAEHNGYVAAFPMQDPAANGADCWNWFLPAHWHRGAGETAIIAGITTTLARELGVDPGRIYMAGYSAGGAMATVMGAAYPDLYAAIAPMAGAPYSLDPTGALAYKEMGEHKHRIPTFILQGVADEISNYGLGRGTILQWTDTNDLTDDGTLNGSVALQVQKTEYRQLNAGFPVPLLIEHYADKDGELIMALTSPYDHLIDAGLTTSTSGVELQQMMIDFLFAYRREGGEAACTSAS